MKSLLPLFALVLMTVAASADQYVNGYTRANGTYVNGYNRSDANSTVNDNYSTRGNINPYTGQAGTRSPDYSSSYRGYGSQSGYGGSRRSSYGY